jgi:hypothetical protein
MLWRPTVRRLLVGLAILTTCCWLTVSTPHAADPAESSGAKLTRDKKLPAKLKINYDNVMLREILEDLPNLVSESSGAGKLRIKSDPQGVTLTSRFTIKGEMTLSDLLDTIVKDKGWGWYVNSKTGDQNDGAVMLTPNPKERGFKEGTGPAGKGATAKKEMPKDKKDTKEAPKTAGAPNVEASNLLTKAKLQINLKQTEAAKTTLNTLLEKYPDSSSASEAKKMLEKLGK